MIQAAFLPEELLTPEMIAELVKENPTGLALNPLADTLDDKLLTDQLLSLSLVLFICCYKFLEWYFRLML